MDLALLPFPHLHIYEQTDPDDLSTRMNVDTDPRYSEIRDLVRAILSHILGSNQVWTVLSFIFDSISLGSDAAKEALWRKLGQERDLEKGDMRRLLEQDTPAIVFQDLKGSEEAIIWGQVVKGEGEAAERNELFVSMELLKALRDPPPPELSTQEIDAQRARQRFILSMTLMNETVHSLTKAFFGPGLITPKLPALEPDLTGRGGDTGATFEKLSFGFRVEVLWRIEHAKRDDRLWYLEDLVSHFDSRIRMLDLANIQKTQASFRKNKLWVVEDRDLPALPESINSSTHVLYRASGIATPVPLEEWDDKDLEGYVTVRSICSRHFPNSLPVV
ncbi:hypothetical protein B0H11DRAFT_432834 [Mycena galericulata]|nr:hypothetical protein B0H11DRAFT_432834 [Mycena galericulata]